MMNCSCMPEINPTWSWYNNPFTCCHHARVFLNTLTFMLTSNVGLSLFLSISCFVIRMILDLQSEFEGAPYLLEDLLILSSEANQSQASHVQKKFGKQFSLSICYILVWATCFLIQLLQVVFVFLVVVSCSTQMLGRELRPSGRAGTEPSLQTLFVLSEVKRSQLKVPFWHYLAHVIFWYALFQCPFDSRLVNFLLIFSVTWFSKSILFSFHVFMTFSLSYCSWWIFSFHFGQKKILEMFPVFLYFLSFAL